MIHRAFIFFLTYRDALSLVISLLLLVATCCLIRVGWMQSNAATKQALAADSQVKEATRPILILARADETLEWDDINQSLEILNIGAGPAVGTRLSYGDDAESRVRLWIDSLIPPGLRVRFESKEEPLGIGLRLKYWSSGRRCMFVTEITFKNKELRHHYFDMSEDQFESLFSGELGEGSWVRFMFRIPLIGSLVRRRHFQKHLITFREQDLDLLQKRFSEDRTSMH